MDTSDKDEPVTKKDDARARPEEKKTTADQEDARTRDIPPAPRQRDIPMTWEERQNRAQMLLIILFLIVQICGVAIAYAVTQSPSIQLHLEQTRPAFISPDKGQENTVNIVAIGIIGTVFLILLKKYLRFKVRYVVIVAVFGSCTYLADILGFSALVSTLFGIVVTVLRERMENLHILNASVFVSVLGFGAIFGHWVVPEHAVLLLIVLSIYDIIGVLITQHITYLWFGAYKFEKMWRDVLAFVVHVDESEVILVGAGDFGFPMLFTFSVTEFLVQTQSKAFGLVGGTMVAISATLGFAALQIYAMRSERSKDTGLPGLPFVTGGAIAGWLLARLVLGV
ncbi:MAG: presenilin family intramembrane aspartyl protease [Candidatus Undinarchaeales archaeon]|nr:presenilin family intramembrane aspartyl protease [Candidatus Undinarchaeales archaeon]MDP7492472.1 presenilin family intramembrane aspartyl protease [Candidatus Undinarchaeales archaeon]